mgnify:CR=1 FL=1
MTRGTLALVLASAAVMNGLSSPPPGEQAATLSADSNTNETREWVVQAATSRL